MKTKEILHPGVHLKKVKPEAFTNAMIAADLGICRTTLWLFMKGKRRLDPAWAKPLAKITKKPATAREWIELQAAFDVAQVQERTRRARHSGAEIAP